MWGTTEGQAVTRIIKTLRAEVSEQCTNKDPRYPQTLKDSKVIITILKRHCKDKIYI